MDGTETEQTALSTRRGLLAGVGGASALSVLLAACGEPQRDALTPGGSNPNTGAGAGTDQYGRGDLGIARFAVTLEYIEADFYEQATRSGKLSGRAAELARSFGQHEKAHVKALEGAIRKLGGEPPARPEAQFPLDNQDEIIRFALGIESLGASALLAQASKIESKELLAAALSMHSVEGRHAAALASLKGEDPAPLGAFARPTQAAEVLNQLHRLTTGNVA